MDLVVAGIHTGIGKTICSTALVEALQYDYWKPVQAGNLDDSDSIFVKEHISNSKTVIHPEAYKLTIPASPHWAAEQDGTEITLDKLVLPRSDKGIIIESAGGVMSPLSHSLVNLDMIEHLDTPVVLVCSYYLGSINHSLLTIDALRNRSINILGLVFSGKEVASTRSFIKSYSGIPELFSIPEFGELNKNTIKEFASSISNQLSEKLA